MDYNFSGDLKSIREILGLSQQELAELLDIQQITISRNESNNLSEGYVSLDSFLEIVRKFLFIRIY